MLHISTMIDDANTAVAQIQVTHGRTLMQLMQRDDFSMEQKKAVMELLKPIEEAISVAQSKFSYSVNPA